MKNIMGTKADAALTLLRVILGLVFFAHGAQKALGWFGGYGYAGTMGYFASLGIPSIFGMMAICAEFLGGIALILGLLTRVAAIAIFIDMLVAIWLVHVNNGLFINWGLEVVGKTAKGEGIEFHLLVLAMSLVLLARGGGAFSVDHAVSGS